MSQAATGRIRTGLVGFGISGSVFHAPLLAADPDYSMDVIVSADPRRAAEAARRYPGARVVPTPAAMFALAGELDLLVLGTPPLTHFDLAGTAIAHGLHVVVDKPFVTTSAQGEELAGRASDAGVQLTVFQNRRWDADFLTLRRLIAEGELGEIAVFESHYDRFRPAVTDRWKDKRDGGVWADLGPHLIDQAVQLFGTPIGVYADLQAQRQGATAIDYAHVLLRYHRLRVILNAGHLAAESSLRYVVHGTGGSFVKHGLDAQEGQSKAGLRPGDAKWGIDPSPGVLTKQVGDETIRTTPTPERGDYPAFYAAMRDAILGKGPPPVTADQALTVMRIIDAGRRSAAERREIAL